jgi:hypothetical protein
VRLDRPLTSVMCMLIVLGAWLAALLQGWTWVALAEAIVVTLLATAVLLHYIRVISGPPVSSIPRELPRRQESAQFRRNLFNLLAALKLGIRFCEDHMNGEPEELVNQLEQMSENIDAFVNQIARPVRFYQRGSWAWRLHPRWPWRANDPRPTDK